MNIALLGNEHPCQWFYPCPTRHFGPRWFSWIPFPQWFYHSLSSCLAFAPFWVFVWGRMFRQLDDFHLLPYLPPVFYFLRIHLLLMLYIWLNFFFLHLSIKLVCDICLVCFGPLILFLQCMSLLLFSNPVWESCWILLRLSLTSILEVDLGKISWQIWKMFGFPLNGIERKVYIKRFEAIQKSIWT